MQIRCTGCCAMSEITGLSTHLTAREAMTAFCRETGVTLYKPHAFYLFTAVVRQPGSRPTYGQNFAALIRRNKLGALRESVAKPNRVNHPSHIVKVWIWSPNISNLRKWDRGH